MIRYAAPILPNGNRVARIVQVYADQGTLEVRQGGSRVYNDTGETLKILAVRASVADPPSGGPIICDVNLDGTTIFGNQSARPTIADGQHTGKTTGMTVTEWPDGSYLTADIDEVGPDEPGAGLTVQVTVG